MFSAQDTSQNPIPYEAASVAPSFSGTWKIQINKRLLVKELMIKVKFCINNCLRNYDVEYKIPFIVVKDICSKIYVLPKVTH